MEQSPILTQALWLGGSTCAGKTAVARRLAAAHGLRLYHCDDAFEDHRRRARPDRHPGFHRIMDLTGPELWSLPADRQVEDLLAFYQDGFELILEDLRALPPGPPVLVEGTGLLPDALHPLLPEPHRALFLISTPAFRRLRYPERGAWVREELAGTGDPEETFARWMSRDDTLARWRAERAAARGLETIEVDGSRTIEEIADLTGRWFRLTFSPAGSPG
jgi:hypothetical protein